MEFFGNYMINVWILVEQVLSKPELYLLSFSAWAFLYGGSDDEACEEVCLGRPEQSQFMFGQE